MIYRTSSIPQKLVPGLNFWMGPIFLSKFQKRRIFREKDDIHY